MAGNVPKMTPKFLLAKYVPDLSRMEPRNIGVLLWANGEIAARFLPPSDARFVGDIAAYEWWIAAWNSDIAGDAIKPVRGKAVSKRDPECLSALLTKQENNYLLVDAGELLEPIGKRQLQDAVDFLFGDLVAAPEQHHPGTETRASVGLRDYCETLFRTTGIAGRPDYHEDHPVKCPVYGVKKHLKFSHYIGNGHPDALFQQTNLRNQQSVNSSALMLHAVTESAMLPKDRCAALARESDLSTEAASEGLALLQAVCPVIFVDSEHASEKIIEVALRGGVEL
jgi:hypothetical protein